MSYEYIDTDVEYIRTIPKTWDLVHNKHLFNKTKVIVGSNWDKYNVLSLTKKGVIIKDIENNQGKMPSDFSIYQLVNPGNLLMCLFDIDVTPRCVGYIENKGIVSAAYTELSPVEEIDMKYYYWWYLMLDIDKQLLHLSKNLRNSLSTEDFMALSVVKPPLEEQKQIANYLDKKTAKIDATIAKNEELIQLLEEKRVALINQVVTKGLNPDVPMKDSGVEWIGEIPEHYLMMKISNMFNNIGSGTTPKSSNEEYYINGDVNWLITGDLNDDYIYETSTQITTKALHDTSSLKIYPQDSLVIAMYGATIGKLGILKVETCTNQACCVLSRSNNLKIKYVYYWFLGYRNEIISLSYGGGQPNISQDVIKNLKIIVPPLNEQTNIVNYLDNEITNINTTISKINDNIELLEEYKTSLIHHVVTGKIDVRGEGI